MKPSLMRRAADADVCLLLEGTFPYVRGGVSSWVNGMIRSYPELRFSIVFVGSREEDYEGAAYALPDNVVHFEAHYLYEAAHADKDASREIPGDAQAFARSAALHDAWRNRGNSVAASDPGALMADMVHMIGDNGPLNEEQFLSSRAAWDFIVDQYDRYCTDPSFTDYFWTVRIMHKPLWQLARVAEQVPPAKVYHTVSTGYAGFLGALLHYRSGRPLLVSEHGIYTKERKIDLLQSQWIRDNRGAFERDISKISYFRELWVRFFEALGKLAYDAADDIVALYETNRQRQIADGALASRTRNIPNGVDVDALAPLVEQRVARPRNVVALIGRVVPIKDIKTFIRALFIASRTMPDIEGWIVGPEEEDAAYALECRALVQSLGLAKNVKFLGFQRIDEILPQVDVIALTSISEALPLVVLEGFAAGVPSITTDVGSCRQLIDGYGDEDRALGSAGSVVPIANPAAFAQAVLDLLGDEPRWLAAQQAGLARVRRFYTKKQMIDQYRVLYERLTTAPTRDGRESGNAAAARGGCPMHHDSAQTQPREVR
ncbi:MAG: Pellicle/biofilm biosynthesis protein PelF, CAZy glycosyltransferase family 4 [uncultured Paraburkholderia sp.]|uniref:GT4 family glycosyltransferase PelF n=1 Tax=uncultured Paraburkholderia sp. TaxID=1822466 RepID=UPI002598EFB1|nr:GT4 family glycosyltransferase PelF [uncultured Paraburkholderia sp.]CAH2899713.1 MAG: Pellicle/biofilm biosynthesis protein PelF, CAZy glycosyltransferase family 4 [uncultured Paraburkholderia sp.]CAH2927774.1 MAG: Pellicle/biofilm biosynthesis protein PelF, CAZy glycosyltransferase family 4 [uncultured Paraburkholderia sp.]